MSNFCPPNGTFINRVLSATFQPLTNVLPSELNLVPANPLTGFLPNLSGIKRETKAHRD